MTTSAGILRSHLTLKLQDLLSRDGEFSARFSMVRSQIKVGMALCLLAEICGNAQAYFCIPDIVKFLEGVLDESKIIDLLTDTCWFKGESITSGGFVRTGYRIERESYPPLFGFTFGRGDSLLLYVIRIDAEEIGLTPGEPV